MRLSERGYIMSVNLTPQAAQNQKIVCAHGETLNKVLHLPKIFTSEITHRQRCTKLRALVDVSNLHLQNCKSHCKSSQSIIINIQISSGDPASKLQICFIEFSNIAIDVHRLPLSYCSYRQSILQTYTECRVEQRTVYKIMLIQFMNSPRNYLKL